jgi:hypothetical protein
MSDFPTALGHPNHVAVSSSDNTTLVGQAALTQNGTVSAAVWPVANTAFYIPFMVEIPFRASNAAVRVSVQAGNLDVGVYDEGGTALVTKGSTLVAVAGLQVIDLTASISLGTADPLLNPGTYYFGMNCSSTTASFFRLANVSIGNLRVCGVRQQAVGAVALPSTATFAVMAATYCPDFLLSDSSIL